MQQIWHKQRGGEADLNSYYVNLQQDHEGTGSEDHDEALTSMFNKERLQNIKSLLFKGDGGWNPKYDN